MSASHKITILLVEDHAVVRQALCHFIEQSGHYLVVGQAQDGREAVILAAKLRPHVIVMDLGMPLLNGEGATRQILLAHPAAKILVLSAHSDHTDVERLSRAGARGFIEKQASADILLQAIREVAAGRLFYSPAIAGRTASIKERSLGRRGLHKPAAVYLTSRELEVLQLVAEGRGNKQAAVVLGISVKTVAKHRQQLMDKLDIHETAGLTRYAMARRIIDRTELLPAE